MTEPVPAGKLSIFDLFGTYRGETPKKGKKALATARKEQEREERERQAEQVRQSDGDLMAFAMRSAPALSPKPSPALLGVERLSKVTDAERVKANDLARTVIQGDGELTHHALDALRGWSGEGGLGGSTNAFYTPRALVDAVWAVSMALASPVRVLEPSCGGGAFLTAAPAKLELTAVEYDATTARIAQALHPHVAVHHAPFERYTTRSEDGPFDLVIGNPPFGVRGASARLHRPDLAVAHWYFVLASLERLKPGGYLAFVLPEAMMRNPSELSLREAVVDAAQVLAVSAVPEGAFASTGAGVTTSVLFLRKHDAGVTEGLAALTDEERRSLRDRRLADDDYLKAFVNGQSLFRKDHAGNWQLSWGDHHLGAHTHKRPVRSGRFDSPEYFGSLEADETKITALTGLCQARRHDILTRTGLEAAAFTLLSVESADRVRRAPMRLHAIQEGTLSPDRAYRFRMGKWSYNGPLENPATLSALSVAQAVVRARTQAVRGGPGALTAKQRALTEHEDHVASYGAYDLVSLEQGARQIPLLRLLVDARGDVEQLLTDLTPPETVIQPGTVQHVAQQLESYGLLTLDNLTAYAGVPRSAAQAHLLSAYAFTGRVWEDASTYYRGNAAEKARQAELLADDARGLERDALLTQASKLRALAPWRDLSDMVLEPRDPLMPEAALTEWVNAYLGTKVAVKRNHWDAEGEPTNLIIASRGEFGVSLRVRNTLDEKMNLADRQKIPTARVRDLEAYLNFRTPVEPVQNQDTKTPDQVNAERNVNQERAVRVEKLIAAHFREWVFGSEFAPHIESALNEGRYGLIEGMTDMRPLNLTAWRGPEPHPFQAGHVRNLARMSGAIVEFGVGLGKALAHGTGVLTPTGYRPIEALTVGDQVIGQNGRATRVTGVYPQGVRPVYRVTFNDGASVVCDEDHLWAVRRPHRPGRDNAYRVLSTREILREGLSDRAGGRGRRHFIPMVEPVQFEPQAPLPVAPYLLGALLGDGGMTTSKRPARKDGGARNDNMRLSFTTADAELAAAVADLLPLGVSLQKIPATVTAKYDYLLVRQGSGVNPLKEALRTLGLAGCTSRTKFVPDMYKFADSESRIALLQGLLDTDGHVRAKDGNIEFTSVSLALAQDVQFLVNSLGGTARMREKRGPDGQFVAYRMSVILPEGIAPFRLSRKAALIRRRTKYPPYRCISAIEPLGTQPATCIAVEAPDHLFVTEYCVVTHNTYTGLMLAALLLQSGRARMPTIVVPLSRLGDWVMNALSALPDLKLLVIGGDVLKNEDGTYRVDEHGEPDVREDAGPRRKKKMMQLISDAPELVIMTAEAFESIPMLEDTRLAYIEREATLMSGVGTASSFDDRSRKMSGHKALAKRERFLQRHMARVKVSTETDVPFEATGIDAVIVDECHMHKSVFAAPTVYGESNPKFLGGSGESNRALDALHKLRFVRTQGGCTVGLTATWFTNSPLEIFNMLTLYTDELARYGISDVSAFTARFCVIEPRLITLPNGDVEYRSCVIGFRNLDEMRAIIFQHVVRETEDTCLMQGGEVGMKLPDLVTQEHFFDLAPAVQARYDEEQAKVEEADSKGENHLFAIFGRLMKLTLHPQLLGVDAPNPRFAECVKACLSARERGGRNVVFMYMGGSEGQAYEALKDAMIAAGYPAREIVVLTATTHPKSGERLKVERRFRRGEISCVIGSAVIEQGANYQGCTDLHHLDYPHHHQAFKQRIGRARRQGTWVREVHNHLYFARGSFDVLRYQGMLGKKGWAEQVYDPSVITCENMDLGFDGEEIAVMLSRDPDLTRRTIQAKREARAQESRAATLLADLEVIRTYMEYVKLLALRQRTAAAREKGPSSQDVAGINRLVTSLRALHGRVRALQQAGHPMAALTRLERPITWAQGLPLHEGMTLELGGVEVTVKRAAAADPEVIVLFGSKHETVMVDQFSAAKNVLPTQDENAYGQDIFESLPARLRERIESSDVGPVTANLTLPVLTPAPEPVAPPVAATAPVGESANIPFTPAPKPLRYGLSVAAAVAQGATVFTVAGDTLVPGSQDGAPLLALEYRPNGDLRQVNLVFPDDARRNATRRLIKAGDPRLRQRVDALLASVV